MNRRQFILFSAASLAGRALAHAADTVWVVVGNADGTQTTFAAKPVKPGDKPLPAALKGATDAAVAAASDTIIAKAGDKVTDLLTRANGRTLLLPAGSTWTEKFAIDAAKGRAPARLAVTGSGAAPVVRVKGTALDVRNTETITIDGIGFDGVDHSNTVGVILKARNVTLHNVAVWGGKFGLTVQGCTNFTADAIKVCDNYNPGSRAWDSVEIGAGLYADSTNGLTIVNSLFDANGWDASGRGRNGAANEYSHNAYLRGDNSGVITIVGNIFANGGSHGLQARAGGDVKGNLFLNNPIGLSWGLVYGEGPIHAGGVTGEVSGNVFAGSRDIAGQPRGNAIALANVLKGRVVDNVMLGDATTKQQAIIVDVCRITGKAGVYGGPKSVGIVSLDVLDNVVASWQGGTYTTAAEVGTALPAGKVDLAGAANRVKARLNVQTKWAARGTALLSVVDYRSVLGDGYATRARTVTPDVQAMLAKLRAAAGSHS